MRAASVVTAISFLLPLVLCAQDSDLKRRTPESEAERIKLERRVTLDIQVTDQSGNALRGLPESSFVLKDNGEPVPLTSFQEVDGRAAQPPVQVILLLDAMNASFEDVGIVRQGMNKFLRQNGGQLPFPVSIVFLTDTGIKLNKPSTNGIELAKDFSKVPTPIRVLDPAQGLGGAFDRAQRSLRALQLLCTYEAVRPGRKLLVWMGPGWPLLAGVRTSAVSAKDARIYYSAVVGTTTDLRRAHITLYSVAPLNLARGNAEAAFLYQEFLKGVTKPSQADSPNLGVQVLAVHSGGLVLNKSGDLQAQINRCIADAESYYEVTFDAAAGDESGVYHPIDVTVGRPGATARTNTAYYAGKTQFTGEEIRSAVPRQASPESPPPHP